MLTKQIVALGFFDGVHLGHQALLDACRTLAKEFKCQAGVVTFGVHPDALVHGVAPGLINTLSDRTRLLKEVYGMDQVTVLPFDSVMRNMSAQQFFDLLRKDFAVAGFVCGEDFRFGFRGEGNAQKLQMLCEEAGIPFRVVPAVRKDGQVISSTRIRDYMETGHMSMAVACLGHPYLLTGKVIHGKALGRTLGIPTANLILPKELVVPMFGVYACAVVIDGVRYAAVTNIGTRPTVAGIGITVEAWILDYEGELYGEEMTLEFHQFLRREERFPSLEALKQEIFRNARQTREILKEVSYPWACTQRENVVK